MFSFTFLSIWICILFCSCRDSHSLESMPKAVAAGSNAAVVACINHVSDNIHRSEPDLINTNVFILRKVCICIYNCKLWIMTMLNQILLHLFFITACNLDVKYMYNFTLKVNVTICIVSFKIYMHHLWLTMKTMKNM